MATPHWQGNATAGNTGKWDYDNAPTYVGSNWLTDSVANGGVAGPKPAANDDGFMLAADKGTNYCTTGPAVAVTIHSLMVAVAADVATAPGILSAGAAAITISSTFSFTEPAPTTALSGGNTFGSTTFAATPRLASGCVGTCYVAPRGASSYATFITIIESGAAETVYVRDKNVLASEVAVGGTVYGTLTILPDPAGVTKNGTGRLRSSTSDVQGTVNLGTPSISVNMLSCSVAAPGVINITAPVVFNLSTSAFTAAATINVSSTGSLVFISGDGSATVVAESVVINAHADVAISNFTIAAGKSLTVNILETQAKCSPGYILYGAGATLSIVGASVIPAAVDVRYGTAAGQTTGTLRVPAAGDVREGTLVDAGVGTLAIGPVFLL